MFLGTARGVTRAQDTLLDSYLPSLKNWSTGPIPSIKGHRVKSLSWNPPLRCSQVPPPRNRFLSSQKNHLRQRSPKPGLQYVESRGLQLEVHEDGEITEDGDIDVEKDQQEEDDGEENFSDSVESMSLAPNSSDPASPSQPIEYSASM